MKLKICITGANGFIGSALLKKLVEEGHTVNVLTRNKIDSTEQIKYYAADLLDEQSCLDTFLDGVSVIYHCAGEIKNESRMYGLHVEGTRRLLEVLCSKILNTGKAVHWVQLSSVGAYGSPAGKANEPRVITEDTICKPVGKYEITKTLSDDLLLQFAKKQSLLTYTILRPSNVIASNMPNQSLRSLVKMIKNRLFFYIGNRTSVATYIHLDDVVDALLLCGKDARAHGQVFNLSNDCALSDIVNTVSTTSFIKPPNICVPERPLRLFVKIISTVVRIPLTQDRIDALVRHTHYPANKLRVILGFMPKHDIASAASNMFDKN
jgi:nucleoside-diphosphate-sugar epimerase